MEIEAVTSSFSFDIEEKSRSFQDSEMSYDDLIKTILLDYKIYSFTQCMDRPMSIGKPLFQYKETDYEFLKRVASHLGLQLVCDIINPNNVFYFGNPTGRSYEIEDDIDYTASLDIKKYRESIGYSNDFHPTDFFYYMIKTRKVMEIGAKVTFKEKEFYVNSYEAEYIRGDLIFTYKLCRRKGIWQEKLYNDNIKGISLEGRVMEVSGEQVKLHLNIDEAQNQSKAAWFRYAPSTGNLMYSMPIVGTNANLYFPSERSQDPMIIGCIRKNGSSCENFSNVNNRYFATESGNNLDMLPGAINFSRPGLSANFNDGSGITLSSSSNLSISAGYVGIFAGDISIEGTTTLTAKKGDASTISLESDFYNSAGVIMENGSDRASNPKFTDDEPTNGAAEARAAMEAIVQFAVGVIAGAIEGAFGKIGECIFNGAENNSENVKDVRLGASPEDLSKDEMDSLPEYTETNTSSEFNNLGPDGVRAKYECNDGTKVTGKVILGSDITPTFIPDNRSEYNEHNSWFSKDNFTSMGNGVKASLIQQSNAFMDVFLVAQTPLVGWDTVKSQMAYENEQTQKEVERLRNESPSKRQFDNTNFSSNVGFTAYDIATGIESIPEMWKMGKATFNIGKSAVKNISKYLEELKDVIKGGKKVASESEYILDDIINTYEGVGKANNVITEADRIKQFNLSNCREQMKDALSKCRNELLNNSDAKDIRKICSTADLGDLNLKGEAGSGIWKYNPTIKDYTGVDPREFCKTAEDYTEYYRSLLSDEYLESLPDSFWIGKNKEFVKEDMSKLRADIERVKSEAVDEGKFNVYGEPSFESDWNVDNCAEIWSSRDAILKGARYDDLVYRTENLKGGFAEPCENCKRTFKGTYNIDN